MSGRNYLLDTNIVLYLLGGDRILAEILDGKNPYLSFITEMELLGSPRLSAKEEKTIRSFLEASHIVDINLDIKKEAILIRRTMGIKLPDSIIAATAKYLDIPLLTADVEFNKLKSLSILQYKP